MSGTKFLIVVGGPTASGKTELAIRLAQHFGTEVLSADSRQFYREMGIGTAKPTSRELAQVKHHFIDSLSIHDPYSVGDFERDALALLQELFVDRDVVVLAGGSGLYVKALCEGLDEFPEVPDAVRDEVEQLYQKQGIGALQEALANLDPEYYAQVDIHNPHRLIRAIAVCRASGQPYSGFRRKAVIPRFFTPIYLEIYWNRQELYRRIDARVERMFREGLLEEARGLLPFADRTALQTVGYQELFDHFNGAIDLATAQSLIQRNSRRYAKRQLTWTRRDGHWKHFKTSEWPAMQAYLSFVIGGQLSLRKNPVHRAEALAYLPNEAIGFGHQETPVSTLPYSETKDGLVIFPQAGTPGPHVHWLAHEALYRAGGQPVLALQEPTFTGAFESLGFQLLPHAQAPARLQRALPPDTPAHVWLHQGI